MDVGFERRAIRGYQVKQKPKFYGTSWYRVLAPDRSLWCETSNEEEARDSMRPGDILQKLYKAELMEWRVIR